MISVVIPLFKVEKYIVPCLESFEKQTYKDFEIIIINDGSPDKSAEIVKNYSKSSSLNIHLVNQENKGVSRARNQGIRIAKGEYICFVDSDDMVDKRYLELLYKGITKTNADLAFCKPLSISEDTPVAPIFNEKYKKKIYNKDEMLRNLLYNSNSYGIWSLLISRRIIEHTWFNEKAKYSEDLEMVWKLVSNSNLICILDAPLYYYRIRATSAMASLNQRRVDGMRLFENLENYISLHAPNIYNEFKKYGVSKWVWSTVWQEAHGAKDYNAFLENIKKYNPEKYFRRLISFPNQKVAITSWIFTKSKMMYYIIIRTIKRNYRVVG